MKKCLVLTIGDEILDGRIVNTNAAYFGNLLRQHGISCVEHRSIPDKKAAIIKSVRESACDLVVISGGLGPTIDDLTTLSIGEALNLPLCLDNKSLDKIKKIYKYRNRPMTPEVARQAYFPKGAKIISNEYGVAPGYFLKTKNTIFVVLPGVPSECRPMLGHFLNRFAPIHFNNRRLLWRCFGLPESKMQTMLNPLLISFKEYSGVKIGIHIDFPCVDFSLEMTPEGKTPKLSEWKTWEKKVSLALGDFVFQRTKMSLAETLVELLREYGKKVAFAESCSGGLLSKLMTDIPGSSAVFWGAVVSYDNAAKEKLLGVKNSTLKKFGAVSPECAAEMSQNILQIAGADFGISITGISGPGGGTKDKPVGLSYVGISDAHGNTSLHRVLGAQYFNRDQNRTFAVHFALDILRRQLLG